MLNISQTLARHCSQKTILELLQHVRSDCDCQKWGFSVHLANTAGLLGFHLILHIHLQSFQKLSTFQTAAVWPVVATLAGRSGCKLPLKSEETEKEKKKKYCKCLPANWLLERLSSSCSFIIAGRHFCVRGRPNKQKWRGFLGRKYTFIFCLKPYWLWQEFTMMHQVWRVSITL